MLRVEQSTHPPTLSKGIMFYPKLLGQEMNLSSINSSLSTRLHVYTLRSVQWIFQLTCNHYQQQRSDREVR